MEVKHTAGPWEAKYSERRDNYQIWGNGHWIANTKCESTPRDHEANASLIAAAPELLEAHKASLDLIEPFEEWQLATLPAWARTALELVKRNASEAVAKAEGR